MPSQSPDHWGAVIAVGGVLLGGILSLTSATFAAWRERKHRRKEMLLAKLDELAVEDQTIQRWLSDLRSRNSVLQMQQLHPVLPCSRIEVLASIYFPRLTKPVAKYTEALRLYYMWAFAQVSKLSKDGNLPHPLLWCLTLSDKDSVERHHQDIQSCRRTLADSVATEAKRLLE